MVNRRETMTTFSPQGGESLEDGDLPMENQVTPEPGAGTIVDAAERINSLLEPQDGDPVEATEAEQGIEATEPEDEPEETQEGDSESDSEDEETGEEAEPETEESEQDEQESWSLDELAEAMGSTPEKVLESIKLKTKVNGIESEIKLGELRNGYQRDQDYTQKSMRLGEERKAFEAERESVKADIETRLHQLDGLITAAEKQLVGDYDRINWDELRSYDPAEYSAKRQEFGEKWNAIQAEKQKALDEVGRLKQEQEQKQQALTQERLTQEMEALHGEIKEWRDPKVEQKEGREVRDYIISQGSTPEAILMEFGHKGIVAMRKAMLYDNLQKGKPAITKKVSSAPKLVKPGSKKSKSDIEGEVRNKKFSKLRKSGRLEDAASVISDFL